jgi:hypothetical protein
MRIALRAVKDRAGRILRRAAVRFLTGSSGRLAAFLIDVWIATARYARRRALGRETPW